MMPYTNYTNVDFFIVCSSILSFYCHGLKILIPQAGKSIFIQKNAAAAGGSENFILMKIPVILLTPHRDYH